ncbi:MAG: proton-conducting transporter membrane subunit [Gemmataceae bacterium]
MTSLHFPWLVLAAGLPLIGAIVVGRLRRGEQAFLWAAVFHATTLACCVGAAVDFYLSRTAEAWDPTPLAGRQLFVIDDLNAPLLPLVAGLHFLRTFTTARTQMRRSSFALALIAESIRVAVFSCRAPGPLIAFLVAGIVPPIVEQVSRNRSVRIYCAHMALFVVLMIGGWAAIGVSTSLAAAMLLGAVLVRSGVVPVHCWLIDLFESATLGTAALFVCPLTGAYLAVRLVLPIAPEWVLQSLGVASLVTAVYASCMAVVQQDARRFVAYLFLSHASLVLVGLELHTEVSLTGALALWVSVALSVGGFGLALRALEARYGRLSLTDYRGLYEQSPALATCFLLTGLGCVGFPGTLGFIGAEMLVDGAVEASPLVGVAIAASSALNGIAVMRAYFLLFTGTRHISSVSLTVRLRERLALVTLALLIVGGGLVAQPGIESRRRAAEAVLAERRDRLDNPAEPKRGASVAVFVP